MKLYQQLLSIFFLMFRLKKSTQISPRTPFLYRYFFRLSFKDLNSSSGCFKYSRNSLRNVFSSISSVHQRTLQQLIKRFNIKFLLECVQKFHDFHDSSSRSLCRDFFRIFTRYSSRCYLKNLSDISFNDSSKNSCIGDALGHFFKNIS